MMLAGPVLPPQLHALQGHAHCCVQALVVLEDEEGGRTLSSAAALRLSAYFRTLRVPSAAATKFAPGHTSMPAQQRPVWHECKSLH